jgi:hypothetical protein
METRKKEASLLVSSSQMNPEKIIYQVLEVPGMLRAPKPENAFFMASGGRQLERWSGPQFSKGLPLW